MPNKLISKFIFAFVGIVFVMSSAAANAMDVHVVSAKRAVAKSSVEVWRAEAGKDAVRIASGVTDSKGLVKFSSVMSAADKPIYIISTGGEIKGNRIPALRLLAVLPSPAPDKIVLNELTTVGSLWPNAQLFDTQKGLRGTANGLIIGSAQVPNLVDVTSGYMGKTALNGDNLMRSETVARMNTLAALVSLCGGNADKNLAEEFLKINNSSDSLEALSKIARAPYKNVDAYFSLFEKALPYPEGEGRRSTSFLPYLGFVPDDFSLQIRFNGGGIFSAGRMMFDVNANLWSGQNFMPGSQSTLYASIGGGVVRLGPGGVALSPPITGYNGQGIDGSGWGTTVSLDKVWISTFNRKVGVYDLQGNVLGPATVDGPVGMLQGLCTAENGDVWVCDYEKNQLILFPGGDHTKGRIVKVQGLHGPFAVVADLKGYIWVSNAGINTVTRFKAVNPTDVKQIKVGISPRGLAVDSKGNVWVAANLTPGYPMPKIPKGTGIIEEFMISIKNITKHQKDYPVTGNITLIDPDGNVLKQNLLNGQIYVGWGVSIAGDDTVFASNFLGTGFMQVCGVNGEVDASGKTSGDLIHAYKSGILQEVTDTMIDDAGNVWLANNWDVIDALTAKDPVRRTSTMGGGNGIVVVYGIASPVTNPLIGAVRPAAQ